MSAFHRQPSRVYWDSELYSNPFYRPHRQSHRAQSSSPGSQDSGFSDTETSPTNTNTKANSPPKSHIDITVNKNNVTTIKVTRSDTNHPTTVDVNDNNLLENVREKFTPTKSNLRQLFEDRYKNGGPGPGAKSVSPKGSTYVTCTPVRRPISTDTNSEPGTHVHRYNKRNTTKVNRNLFKGIQSLERQEKHFNQYATNTATREHLAHNNANEENTKDDDNSNNSNYSITQIPEETQSLPNIDCRSNVDKTETEPVNLTAPATLPEAQRNLNQSDIESCRTDGEISRSKNANSDCDSEIEEIFPKHTSTPKYGPTATMKKDRLGRKLHKDKLLLKYKDERVPPIVYDIDDYNDGSLKAWYTDLNLEYDPECMTALQGKSIAGELAERVAKLASEKTRHLREILNDAIVIYSDIDLLKSPQLLSLQPHCSNLSTCIRSYLTNHPPPSPPAPPTAVRHHCLELSTLKSTPTAAYIDQLTADFNAIQSAVLSAQVRRYHIEELAAPRSELDVRAAVTGLTSVCLHYGEEMARRGIELVGTFVDGGTAHLTDNKFSQGTVEALVALCEICEGSSVRRAILRALATVCATGVAVGRFEASGGVEKAIVDVVTDDALPEVERVEAIALLAQISAPWIDEPSTSLPSIYPHLRPLIRSLTVFAHSSTCKQNLLLCCAALANLTTLYADCVKHIVTFQTVDVLLKCVRNEEESASGSSIEVYVLEQVAVVLANVSATEKGRTYLTTTTTTATALVCFLKTKPYTCLAVNSNSALFSDEGASNHPNEVAVVQRLQQKAIIALSRLCSDPKAAHHVVKIGGVRRLVTLCREKTERYGSDAVLVAALATLRKISETCGVAIMTEQDAQELVEPRLLDSFLAYSAQNESLV